MPQQNDGKKFTLQAKEVAYMLGVKQPVVSAWMKEEVDPLVPIRKVGRAYEFDPRLVVEWRIRRKLQEKIGGRMGMGEESPKVLDFHSQKTRLTKAQADEKELKLRQMRGELVPVEHYQDVLENACQIMHSALSSIPAELQRTSPHLSATDIDGVRKVIARVQNALAGLSVEPGQLGLPASEESLPGDGESVLDAEGS